MQELHETNNALKSQKIEIEQKLKEVEQDRAKKTRLMEKLGKTIQSMSDDLEECDAMRTKMVEQENQMQKCQRRLRELETKSRELSEAETKMTRQLDLINTQKDKLAEYEENLGTERKTLAAVTESLQDLQTQKKTLEDEVQKLRGSIDNRQNEILQLKTKLDQNDAQLNAEREKNRELQQKQADALQVLAQIRGKLKEVEKLDDATAEIQTLQGKIQNLEAQRQQNERELRELREKIATGQRSLQVSRDSEDIEKLKLELKVVGQMFNDKTKINVRLRIELEKLQNKLRNKSKQVDSGPSLDGIAKEMTRVLDNAQKIQKDLEESQRRIVDLEDYGKKSLRFELAANIEQGLEEDERYRKKSDELRDIQIGESQLRESRRIIEDSIRKTQALQQTTERQMKSFEGQVSKQLEGHAKDATKCEEEKKKLQAELADLQYELDNKYIPRQQELIAEVAKHKEENEKMQRAHEAELANARKKQDKSLRKLTEFPKDKLQKVEERMKNFYKKIYDEECKRQLKDLQTRHNISAEDRDKKFQELADNLKEADKRNEALEKSVGILRKELEKRQARVEEYVRSKAEYDAMMDARQKEVDTARREYEKCTLEFEKLQKSVEKCQETLNRERQEKEAIMKASIKNQPEYETIRNIGDGIYFLHLLKSKSVGIFTDPAMSREQVIAATDKWLRNPKHKGLPCRHRQVSEALQWLKSKTDLDFVSAKNIIQK